MKTLLGPALDIAPLVHASPPFDTLPSIADQASSMGYGALLLPSWDPRVLDLARAAGDTAYCDEIRTTLSQRGLGIAALSVTVQSRLLATHPAHALLPSPDVPPGLDTDAGRHAWAAAQLHLAARACENLGVRTVVARSGALLAPFAAPGFALPPGLVETAWEEIGRRFRPVLDDFAARQVDLCIVPSLGCDVHDGVTFEALRASVGDHERCALALDSASLWMQQIDPLGFVDHYRAHLRVFLVSDAEILPSARQGMFGLGGAARDRPVRLRAPGDGQVDLAALFGRLAHHDFPGWAVVSPVCVLRHPVDVALTSAPLVSAFIPRAADPEPPPGPADTALNRALLGLP